MSGISTIQLRDYIVTPVLLHLGAYSDAAQQLVLGTALQESNGAYLHQLGKGPALGLWQMEPATHDDIWHNYIAFNSTLLARMSRLLTDAELTDGANEMIGNLYYACAMCRVHYLRVKQPLPAAGDAAGLASYWKQHYNTVLGAGTWQQALPHFEEACK